MIAAKTATDACRRRGALLVGRLLGDAELATLDYNLIRGRASGRSITPR